MKIPCFYFNNITRIHGFSMTQKKENHLRAATSTSDKNYILKKCTYGMCVGKKSSKRKLHNFYEVWFKISMVKENILSICTTVKISFHGNNTAL